MARKRLAKLGGVGPQEWRPAIVAAPADYKDHRTSFIFNPLPHNHISDLCNPLPTRGMFLPVAAPKRDHDEWSVR